MTSLLVRILPPFPANSQVSSLSGHSGEVYKENNTSSTCKLIVLAIKHFGSIRETQSIGMAFIKDRSTDNNSYLETGKFLSRDRKNQHLAIIFRD